jgi:energy-coupling factor transporter ATP-binding protein EcfA2
VLRELRIKNLAIFDAVTIPFAPGLNVLTGETGAGKSIMIDALTLLLGERAQPAETIRTGAENATLEAVFALPKKSPVPALLEAHGFAPDEGGLIVRRELVRSGRGRVFLNDSNATSRWPRSSASCSSRSTASTRPRPCSARAATWTSWTPSAASSSCGTSSPSGGRSGDRRATS